MTNNSVLDFINSTTTFAMLFAIVLALLIVAAKLDKARPKRVRAHR